jgi:outer membrane immunogenic protein
MKSRFAVIGMAFAAVGTIALGASQARADGYEGRARVYGHPFTWSGCYVGVHAGGGWADKAWTDPALANIEFSSHRADGFVGGGQAGCDLQTGMFVFGVEGSASWSDLRGSSIDTLSAGTLRDHSQVDFIGTLTARAGVAFDRSLLYVKGGAAVADDRYRANIVPSGVLFYSASESRWGWVIGAGLEHALDRHWSVKVEYNYMDFGSDRLNFRGGTFAGVAPFDIDQQAQVVKLGINYRFGGDDRRPLK